MDITVNGNAVPFNMKIGEAGEAFFVFETDSDVPDDLITSPLLEPTEPVSTDPMSLGDFGRFGARDHRDGFTEDEIGQEPEFLDLNASSTSLSGEREASITSAPSNVSQSVGTSFRRAGNSSDITVKSDDEAHPTLFVEEFSTSRSNGGMSCFTFFQCSFDSR